MYCTLLKSKLHGASVTHSELEYEGSCAIDAGLLRAANILEYEQIQIYNVSNGERLTTYAIRADDGSGIISVNGAAAHKAKPGERLIICAYVGLEEKELATFRPTLVYLDQKNRISHIRNAIPVQAA